ncbi:ataxin 3-like [Globodera pallida]|nr:ataxin 3-like [Globodera pallida]
MDLVYHEKQIGRMCAQHALNMLLQGHYFTPDSLASIARELDQREMAMLRDESQFQSQNYDESGYFSIQVITEALRRQANLHLEPLESPNVLKILQNPSLAYAYICHLEDHWFSIRKIGTTWFILNSLFKSPRLVSESFLELYITQLHAEGWSIYVIEGELPACAAETVPREFWNETRRTKKLESDIEKAIALSLNEAQPFIVTKTSDEELFGTATPVVSQAEELDIQRALEDSLREANKANSVRSAESLLVGEAIRNSVLDLNSSSSTSKQTNEDEEDPHNQQSCSSGYQR